MLLNKDINWVIIYQTTAYCYIITVSIFLVGFTVSAESFQTDCISLYRVRGLVESSFGNGFIIITKPHGNYGLNRMWFKNFTLHTWNMFIHCLLVGRYWCLCRLLAMDLAAAIVASVGSTVNISKGTWLISWAYHWSLLVSAVAWVLHVERQVVWLVPLIWLLFVYPVSPYNFFSCINHTWMGSCSFG